MLPGAALCGGTAVVLGAAAPAAQIGPVPPAGLAGNWPGLAGVLARRGYDDLVIVPDGPGAMLSALETVRGGIDLTAPLLIIAQGDLAGNHADGDRLVFDAGPVAADRPWLPLEAVMSLADGQEGITVVLLASDRPQDEAVVERLLAAAPQDAAIRSRLLATSMDPAYVPGFLDRGLLRDGVPLSAIWSVLPSGAHVAGALSRDLSLSGIVEPAVVEDLAYEAGLWSAFRSLEASEALRRYLDLRPRGAHAAEARARLYTLTYNSLADAQAQEAELALTEAQRADIQNDIAYLGFYEGRIDGVWGDSSRAAIRDWQLRSGLPATGHVSAGQLTVLRGQVARRTEADRRDAIDRERVEREFWMATGQRGSQRELLAYLERYPAGIFASIAEDRLSMLDEAIRAHAGLGGGATGDPAAVGPATEPGVPAVRPRPRPGQQPDAAAGVAPRSRPAADGWQSGPQPDVPSRTMYR